MSLEAIRVEGLRKDYGAVAAVRGVSFAIEPGEVFGLLGPNGAGKTTILRILTGLAFRTAGEVEILGQPVPRALHRVMGRVGVVFERPDYPPNLPAIEVLRMLGCWAGLDLPAPRLGEALERVGLGEAAGRRVGGFSAGMRQRLSLAAALIKEPDVLILDEPTSALDPLGVRHLRDLLRDLAAGGTTVLLSSHELREIELLCRRVLLIDRGRTVRYGSLDELLPGTRTVEVQHADVPRAAALLGRRGFTVAEQSGGWIVVEDAAPEEVLAALVRARLPPRGLVPRRLGLEDLFVEAVGKHGGAGPAR